MKKKLARVTRIRALLGILDNAIGAPRFNMRERLQLSYRKADIRNTRLRKYARRAERQLKAYRLRSEFNRRQHYFCPNS